MNNQANLEELVCKYTEGKCSPEELRELEALLLNDAENRRYFLDMVLLVQDLGMMDNPIEHETPVNLLPMHISLQRQRRSTGNIAMLAAAAVILFSAVTMWPQMPPEHEPVLASFLEPLIR